MPTLGSQPEWVKSSLSFVNGNCVEVASLPGGEVAVPNTRVPKRPVLRFTSDEWHTFLGGARNGEFERFGLNRDSVIRLTAYMIDDESFEADGRLWRIVSLQMVR